MCQGIHEDNSMKRYSNKGRKALQNKLVNDEDELNTCLFSLEGALLASLAVCTAASADAASGVARRISQMNC